MMQPRQPAALIAAAMISFAGGASPQPPAAVVRAGAHTPGRTPGPALGRALAPPGALSERGGVNRRRKLDRRGGWDFNHLYSVSGDAPDRTRPGGGAGAARAPEAGLRLGLIDGGVDGGHPALAGAQIEQKLF